MSTTPDRNLFAAVAERRAAGHPWPAIADELDADLDTIRRFPLDYRRRWRTALTAATRALAADALNEAITILRRQLRGKDAAAAQKAAESLARVYAVTGKPTKPGKPKPTEMDKERSVWHRAADLMVGKTDEEIEVMLGRNPKRRSDAEAVEDADS